MAEKYPFNAEEEIKNAGVYLAVPGIYGMPSLPAKKFNTPISPKENFLRVCRKEMPVWMPNMGTDFNLVQPEIMPDAYARIHGGVDWFGIEWQYEPLTNAGMVKPGTRRLSDVTEWEKELIWPDLNTIDWEADYQKNYAPVMDLNRATLFIIVNGYLERLADMTSFADTFCYLLEEQEAVTALFDKLCDFHIQLMRIAKNTYHADAITFHDDMGTQISSFMSPDTFKEVLLPHYQRMNKAAHDMGLYVNFHSCGCVGNLIEYFCDAGFDFWEGQDTCNNKLEILEKYGERLGQVSVFAPEPSISDEEMISQIKERIEVWGKDGKYIPWFIDANPDRKINGTQLLYTMSREYYYNK